MAERISVKSYTWAFSGRVSRRLDNEVRLEIEAVVTDVSSL